VRTAAGVRELLEAREAASRRLFDHEAERIARLCHRMAEQFARDGRLIAIAATPTACSDAHHVAVEFVHPVIVGKRALPAFALAGDLAGLPALAGPDDIVMAFGEPGDDGIAEAVAAARERDSLTIAFADHGAEWAIEPPSADPLIRQELAETAYHVLWELVHVFFEHRGLLQGRRERRSIDVGASSFLYPFLSESEQDLDGVLGDIAASVRMKADEAMELRARTVMLGREALEAAAATLRSAGTVFTIGNGGSATDAADLAADLAARSGVRALDLSSDPAVLTAIANDISSEAVFSRQVIAHGRSGDVLVALSTSGDSRSIVEALIEARRRGLRTVAFAGYDGGRVAAEGLADHLVIAPSQYIPRIQEAHATAYHLLCEAV
jgi:D-sedoheptulose 7-phosphate isomerase